MESDSNKPNIVSIHGFMQDLTQDTNNIPDLLFYRNAETQTHYALLIKLIKRHTCFNSED